MQAEIRENTAIKESWSVIHPLNPEDSARMTILRSAVAGMKGQLEGVAARGPFNGIMERVSTEPVAALREGWDDYVRFAAARPRLYAAMMSRVLQGAQMPAAQQAFALLIERIAAIKAQGRLALTVVAAADLMWASANAASLLYVTAQFRNTVPPSTDVLEDIRENAVGTILTPESEG